jgi:hypothetical protein
MIAALCDFLWVILGNREFPTEHRPPEGPRQPMRVASPRQRSLNEPAIWRGPVAALRDLPRNDPTRATRYDPTRRKSPGWHFEKRYTIAKAR